ncbi:hypothetical protein [Pseudomonas syringae group genomosp. 3]|uniref:hypothetical protein n=1 Tax=Pseudomonas syringae group genomosp. 3 TaxID=251701 RepID=UPI001604F7EF|nr:hypothetical protein [Pseudomonas syringae group genomosp. 3]
MAVTMAAANNERDRQYIQRSFESQVLTGLAGNKPARRPANSYVFYIGRLAVALSTTSSSHI